jgi:hypothetical protein
MPSTIARSRCVRSAPASRSASCGGKIPGSVRGTRTSGTVRDRIDPPCRRVSKPRGTGLACTGVSPRAARQAYSPDTGDKRRAIVRAGQPGLPIRQPHHAAIPALMGQELEHIRRGDLHRALPGHREERLQIEGHRPQRVRPAPACHELQIPVHQPLTQAITDLARPRHAAHKTGKLLISAPSQPGPQERGNDTDHPCIKRYVRTHGCSAGARGRQPSLRDPRRISGSPSGARPGCGPSSTGRAGGRGTAGVSVSGPA